MKKIILSMLLIFIMGACSMNNNEKNQTSETWDKTFKKK